MKSLWLIIPAHRRTDISTITYPQLAALKPQLAAHDIKLDILVIANDANVRLAADNGLRTLERPNDYLGRKWNDGIEHACQHGADYIAPCGSDNWIHPDYLAPLTQHPRSIRCTRTATVIRPDGHEATTINVTYDGGDGIRIIPTSLLQACRYRPAREDRRRGIDTSIHNTLRANGGFRFDYAPEHAHNVIGFQSITPQLNDYDGLKKAFGIRQIREPFAWLRQHFAGGRFDAAEAMFAKRRHR